MISMAFVEQPESVNIRYETSNQTRGAAALPSVVGGLVSHFTLSAFRLAPVGDRIDATDHRLGLNSKLWR